eukprot:CAMPEP_0170519554 /NCGR_PEP_ID=MMETSP0209-20121228/4930_1 /TAXON_ID=665100 ORGANISM="Litonotus pictus, Strain P1" /NCGR_SAMPLE_ID=MMETSP0209 /ASSEMBLY_ACC=CAM_ASM_000301 /LENGTH=239 /DNA_ID=CAMNT_0010805469 /DNA_START=414 /DNA_END=1129 /DNA_ORIENTATION=-
MESQVSKLDYSDYKKIGTYYFPDLKEVGQVLTDYSQKLAALNFSITGLRHKEILSAILCERIREEKHIYDSEVKTIQKKFSEMVQNINEQILKHSVGIEKNSYISQLLKSYSGLPEMKLPSKVYSFVIKDMKNTQGFRNEGERVLRLFNKYGVPSKEEALLSVLNLNSNELAGTNVEHYKAILSSYIMYSNNENIVRLIQNIRPYFSHSLQAKENLEKILLFSYLRQMNDEMLNQLTKT